MDITKTEPAVKIWLTVAEATSLYADLEDVYEALEGPSLSRETERLMSNLGATLETAGLLPDDDPDPEPLGNVLNLVVNGPPDSTGKEFADIIRYMERRNKPERDCAV